MKSIYLSFFFLVVSYCTFGQNIVEGKIIDKKGNSIPFANIYLEGTSEGTISDEKGKFEIRTELSGKQNLVASMVGYETKNIEIIIIENEKINVTIQLEEGTTLSEVVISTGVFDASDEKKATILKPLDIVTTPGASGDIFGALATLPGVAPIQEETGLFVRGGEASETKTIIDGILVSKPFLGDTPDVPGRGRFNPFLFKGTMFSTGAYSAQYGQALSSVLILNTNNIPERNRVGIGINMAGVTASIVNVWNNKTALLTNIGYSNLKPMMDLIPQNRKWIMAPNGVDASFGYRYRSDKGDLFKSFIQYQSNALGLYLPNNENLSTTIPFKSKNHNLFWSNSLKGRLTDEWKYQLNGAYSYDKSVDKYDIYNNEIIENLAQGRVTLKRNFEKLTLTFGNESQFLSKKYRSSSINLSNNQTAFYVENDAKIADKLALRIGFRFEYASILKKWNAMPRANMSYRLKNNSMVSLAYGRFYQTPDYDIFLGQNNLDYEESTHYLINYQWKSKGKTFRIEGYYKDYDNLILFENSTNNDGYGFSKGIDVFWRDQETIKNLTYWFTYSYIDSERLYRDFPTQSTPKFISKHSFNSVFNYNLNQRTRVGFAYTYASGRPYNDVNKQEFLAERTIDYHNLNISGSYLFPFFGKFSVLYMSLRNPFQIKQVFGYRYSSDGVVKKPITPSTNWSIFAGVSIRLN
ncbi:TonB-dependent receptor [Tenacibaculum xiamenense]|uniref:TonB-dependent receptor n=1 Tax=Tenacibaculum xiamenense TaxID=1261553 RepID=UPI003894D186